MGSRFFSKLSIRNDPHVKDKLIDLFGKDIWINPNILSFPIAHEEVVPAFLSMITGKHYETTIQSKPFFLMDGTPCQFPTDSDSSAFLNDVLLNIMKTKTLETLPEAIDEWSEMCKEYSLDARAAMNDVVYSTFGWIGDFEPHKYIEKDGVLEWEFYSDHPQRHPFIDRLSRFLGHGATIQSYFHSADTEQAGIIIYENGKMIANSYHEWFCHPDLDIAMYRGITKEEISRFLDEAGQSLIVDKIMNTEQEELMICQHLIRHILENPEMFDSMDANTKTQVIVNMILIGPSLYYGEVEEAEKLVQDSAFNKDLFMTLKNSEMFDGQSISDIARAATRTIAEQVTTLDIDHLGSVFDTIATHNVNW